MAKTLSVRGTMRIDAMRRPPVGLSKGVQALKVEQKAWNRTMSVWQNYAVFFLGMCTLDLCVRKRKREGNRMPEPQIARSN